MTEISVLIPAFNEEKTIRDTVSCVSRVPGVTQVIVVDDGSRDNTVNLARSAGAEVLELPENCGKGEALNRGAELVHGEIVVLLDADTGPTAAEVEKIILPVIKDEADLAVAQITSSKGSGGFGLVKLLARRGIRFLTGQELNSVLSGQRAMRRKTLEKLLPFAEGFGIEVDMTVKALWSGCRIVEVPVAMSHGETGKDLRGFIHRGKQFLHIFRVFFRLYVGGGRTWRWSSHF